MPCPSVLRRASISAGRVRAISSASSASGLAPRQVAQLRFCRGQPVRQVSQLIGDRGQPPFPQLALALELLMLAASRQHRHARGIHGHPRIGETGPNRVQVLELALMPSASDTSARAASTCSAWRRAASRSASSRVECCALGFGAGLRTTGGGEVRFGLTTCVAGLPVGLVEVRQALDPDLMRLSRGGASASASAASAQRG
jgi:hypothetical protein